MDFPFLLQGPSIVSFSMLALKCHGKDEKNPLMILKQAQGWSLWDLLKRKWCHGWHHNIILNIIVDITINIILKIIKDEIHLWMSIFINVKEVPLVLLSVYSTPILGIILHHICVLFFHVIILMFHFNLHLAHFMFLSLVFMNFVIWT